MSSGENSPSGGDYVLLSGDSSQGATKPAGTLAAAPVATAPATSTAPSSAPEAAATAPKPKASAAAAAAPAAAAASVHQTPVAAQSAAPSTQATSSVNSSSATPVIAATATPIAAPEKSSLKPASLAAPPSVSRAAVHPVASLSAQPGAPSTASVPGGLEPEHGGPVSFFRRPSAAHLAAIDNNRESINLDADYLAGETGSVRVQPSSIGERRRSSARPSIDDAAGEAAGGSARPLLAGGMPRTVHDEFEFPGFGQRSNYDYSTFLTKDLEDAPARAAEREEHKLGEWSATAICGNDITSSCFYTTGLVSAQAGVWAPLCMGIVSLTLYLFRSVYGEAVTALPLNGGAYNVLLNTTSKMVASLAACLTILSYTATAVVSAASAAAYLQNLWTDEPVYWIVVGLLVVFAVLSLIGIGESAKAALGIFVLHMTTLAILLVAGTVQVCRAGIDPAREMYNLPTQPTLARALFYGFAAGMLGVTGFETSANFVEEQKEGVFVKTLLNMWAICAFINPALSLLCVFVIDPKVMAANPNDALAQLGLASAGRWLQVIVSVDAFIVLAGAVLTAYVGFVGLLRRLAMDRCVPGFLAATNEWRGTNHWIILGFLGLCVSLYSILNGAVDVLSNVYTVSFLGVMSLFAVGNMLLKYKRNDLPRTVRALWPVVISGFLLVVYAFVGTVSLNPSILTVWLAYFTGTAFLVGTMFFRVQVLKFTHYFCRSCRRTCCDERDDSTSEWLTSIGNTIKTIRKTPVAFFAKRPIASLLNKAVLYVRQNEDCSWIRIVHCHVSTADLDEFQRVVSFLDEMYPKIKIDLVCAQGAFCPSIVNRLAHELDIPHNLMFMSCPRSGFTHQIADLGGVRLITSI